MPHPPFALQSHGLVISSKVFRSSGRTSSHNQANKGSLRAEKHACPPNNEVVGGSLRAPKGPLCGSIQDP